MPSAIGVIPARYGSSRFPGKPLIDLAGKPMIRHVAERAAKARSLGRVIVATDDERIYEAATASGVEALMTPSDVPSGTDRTALVAEKMDAEIFVNIQGDEPLIEPDEIDSVVGILLDDPRADAGTLVKKLDRLEDLVSPHTAKVVLDQAGYALYFSRNPIPHLRDVEDPEAGIRGHVYWKHIGIYSYRREFLLQYSRWGPTPLERAEKLEQLRILEKGHKIKTAETRFESVCVDTPEDAERVRSLLLQNSRKR
jgi:3-deoxy-manno-octulosonate cytidylyltransferase (CMP-KDO synthetase)